MPHAATAAGGNPAITPAAGAVRAACRTLPSPAGGGAGRRSCGLAAGAAAGAATGAAASSDGGATSRMCTAHCAPARRSRSAAWAPASLAYTTTPWKAAHGKPRRAASPDATSRQAAPAAAASTASASASPAAPLAARRPSRSKWQTRPPQARAVWYKVKNVSGLPTTQQRAPCRQHTQETAPGGGERDLRHLA